MVASVKVTLGRFVSADVLVPVKPPQKHLALVVVTDVIVAVPDEALEATVTVAFCRVKMTPGWNSNTENATVTVAVSADPRVAVTRVSLVRATDSGPLL